MLIKTYSMEPIDKNMSKYENSLHMRISLNFTAKGCRLLNCDEGMQQIWIFSELLFWKYLSFRV